MAHQRVFQRIANQNGGTRASGTPGFDASAAYVKRVMKHAGYRVTEQTFTFPFYQELAPAVLDEVSPTPKSYEPSTFDYSPTGDVTGQIVPTNDIVIPPTPDRARHRDASQRLPAGIRHGAAGRADPTGHMLLRGQGEECGGCRLRRGHHLQ
jgi:hypothetical protein